MGISYVSKECAIIERKKPKTSNKEKVDMYCVRWYVLLDPTKEQHLKLLQEAIKTFKLNDNNHGPFPFCINHFDKETKDFFIENGYLSPEAKWKGQIGMGRKHNSTGEHLYDLERFNVNFYTHNQSLISLDYEKFKQNGGRNDFETEFEHGFAERTRFTKPRREANKQKMNETSKTYYDKNKEKILLQKQTKYICECGTECNNHSKAKHFRTQKHQLYINNK
jgi:hypothetical protein